MKKRALPLFLCLLILIGGCGRLSKEDTSTFSLKKDGTVHSSAVGIFDEDYYDIKELKNAVEELVASYNEAAGGKQVRIESCKLNGQVAKIVLTFESVEDYSAFNQMETYAAPLSEAIDTKAVDPSAVVTEVKGDDRAEVTLAEALEKNGKLKILLVSEELLVEVPGKVRYTGEGVSLRDDGRAVVTATEEGRIILYQ